jgi:small neutral amino acid transporter SnatA (MarC family)
VVPNEKKRYQEIAAIRRVCFRFVLIFVVVVGGGGLSYAFKTSMSSFPMNKEA